MDSSIFYGEILSIYLSNTSYAIGWDKFLSFLHQQKFTKLHWTFNCKVWSVKYVWICMEMLSLWSVNYICQVCKLYFFFGHVRNFGQVLLVNIESALLLALVKYMLCSPFTQNCILLYFLETKNPYFVTKNFWKSSYICVFILSKKWDNWFHKNLHNSGMVGGRKLPDPRWITFLMPYRLVYSMHSHFIQLILAWSTYLCIEKKFENESLKLRTKASKRKKSEW